MTALGGCRRGSAGISPALIFVVSPSRVSLVFVQSRKGYEYVDESVASGTRITDAGRGAGRSMRARDVASPPLTIPTRMISNGNTCPCRKPNNEAVEARIEELADAAGRKLGISDESSWELAAWRPPARHERGVRAVFQLSLIEMFERRPTLRLRASKTCSSSMTTPLCRGSKPSGRSASRRARSNVGSDS